VRIAFFHRLSLPSLLNGLWCLLLCMLVHQAVWAQIASPAAIDLNQASSPLWADERDLTRLPLLALEGLDANSTPAQAMSSKDYVAFQPGAIYELSGRKALWIKLKVKTDPLSQHQWSLLFTKTFLDCLELHYQDALGQWHKEQAGDKIAHALWSQRTLAPQFKLPALPAGEHDLLIKVVQDFPQQIPISLVLDNVASQINQDDVLLSGVMLGLLGVILVLAVHLAISYRDPVYAWYALYALMSLLSVTSYLGVASYLLWPQSDRWPEYSILFLILASVTAQLWFCQAMFLRETQAPRFKRVVQAAAIGCMVLLFVYMLGSSASNRIIMFSVGLVVCMSLIVLIVVQALMRRVQAAYFWVVAYMPLFIVVVMALLENLSFVRPLGLPYSLPAYTLAFEAIVLLFALHLHAKDRHAVQERERALVAVDPLTGFFNARAFNLRMATLWGKLIGSQQDMALALIHVYHTSDKNDPESALRLERKLLRSVRLLHTITRDVDLIGRVGGNVLAVAMPGIPVGEELNNRLARLVALGLMSDPYDTQPMELRFRIAVGTRATWGNDLKSLDNNLRGAIMQSTGWSRRPIHYISAATPVSPLQAGVAMSPVAAMTDASSSEPQGDPPALNANLRSSGGNSSTNSSSPPSQ
jgi:two-component system, sensor histidine kinase LadS